MASHPRAGLQDSDAWMAIGELDHFPGVDAQFAGEARDVAVNSNAQMAGLISSIEHMVILGRREPVTGKDVGCSSPPLSPSNELC